MLDAYSIRKAIPRVLIAVIGINLSIYLCVAMLDITMIVGKGMNSLLVGPFVNDNSFSDISASGSVTGSILGVFATGGVVLGIFGALWASAGAVASAAIALIGLLLPMMILIAFIALAILFTLVIRQGLLVFLTIVSPVAIACYILPGTEKYFKQWFDLYTKTLLVYPIIAVIFAMSNVLGAILLSSSTGSIGSTITSPASIFNHTFNFAQQSGALQTSQVLAAILVMYAPLALIPFAFKLAGGAMAAVMNVANSQARRFSDRAGKAVQQNRQNPDSWLGGHKKRARDRRVDRNATFGQVAAGVSGGIRARRRGEKFREGFTATASSLGGTNSFDAATAFAETSAGKAILSNDDTIHAFKKARNEADAIDMLEKRGYSQLEARQSAAAVMRARGKIGGRASAIAAVRAQMKTGTGYDDNAAMLADMMAATGGDLNNFGRILGEGRGAAAQAGRIDQGTSSFQEQFNAGMYLARGEIKGKDGVMKPFTADDANDMVMESVINSVTPGQGLYGKPKSVQNIAKQHAKRVQKLKNEEFAARTTYEQAQQAHAAGSYTDAELQAAKNQYAQAQRSSSQALASVMGLHDAAAASAPQSVKAVADGLFDVEIFDPATGNRRTVFDMGHDPEYIDNEAYSQARRDFSKAYTADYLKTEQNAALRQAEAEAAARAAASGRGMPTPPGGPPSSPLG